MKICTKCGTEKDENSFNKSSSAKDGLQSWCKECSRANNKNHYKENIDEYTARNKSPERKLYAAQYWAENSETLKAAGRKAYAEDRDARLAQKREHYELNKQKMLDRAKAFSKANKEKVLAHKRKYYLINKETIRAKQKMWCQSNTDAIRINSSNRRAKKKSNGGTISKGLRGKLFKLQKGTCPICREKLPHLIKDQHLDHIVPLARGGANIDSNIQLLCQRCNNRKHAKDPIDFMQEMGYLL